MKTRIIKGRATFIRVNDDAGQAWDCFQSIQRPGLWIVQSGILSSADPSMWKAIAKAKIHGKKNG